MEIIVECLAVFRTGMGPSICVLVLKYTFDSSYMYFILIYFLIQLVHLYLYRLKYQMLVSTFMYFKYTFDST